MSNPVEDIIRVVEKAKERGVEVTKIYVANEEQRVAAEEAAKILRRPVKIVISNSPAVASIENYKKQPFKTDGNGNPIPIEEIWPSLSRRDRREIERLVRKGKNPNIVDYL